MYSEADRGRVRVAYYDPREPIDPAGALEAAEGFGALVKENVLDGASIETVAEWARFAGRYGLLALAAKDDLIRNFGRAYVDESNVITALFGEGSHADE